MKPKKVTNKGRVWVGTFCIALLQSTAIPAWAQLNDECSVTVNGQTVAVRDDGSFRVTNIPAREELVRVYTTCQIEGITLYGVSEFFQVEDLQTYDVRSIAQSPTPLPTTVSLTAAPDDPTLMAVGETTQLNVTALLADETVVDVTPRANGTTYTSSNNAVVTVDQEGIVEAVGRGIAFVTATNEGATAVAQVLVTLITPTSVEGFVHFEDGSPVPDAVVTLVGLEELGFSVTTDPVDGSFLFNDVPADFGAITVDAVKTIEMVDFFAEVVVLTPVPEGITDAGILTLGGSVRWITTFDANWEDGENWSTGSPPGPRETAIIDLKNVDINVFHCSGTSQLGSINSTETILIIGGTLNPTGASTAVDIEIDGGTLEVGGVFKVSNLLKISSGGSLRGTGEMIVIGTLNWMRGEMADEGTTTIPAGGVLTISGFGSKSLESRRTLDIVGGAVWTGSGDIFVNDGSKFNILAGGTFDAQNDGLVNRSFGVLGSFNNAGTFIKSVGTGTTQVHGVPFNNTGMVDVQKGTLRISGGGTNTASFSVAGDATVEFVEDSYTLDPGSTMAGLGLVRVDGTLSVADMVSVTVANLDFEGGSLEGTGQIIVSDTLNWTGGQMAEAGTTKIAAEGVLTMSGTGSKVLESGRKLDIAGNAVWTGSGDIFIDDDSKFKILAGGTFDAQNDKQLSSFGVVGSFTNAGTFIKSVGMGTTNVAILPFNNTGTVEVRTGTLRISGGGTNTNSFSVADGATAEFAENTYTLDTGSTMAGLGIVLVSGTLSVADMAIVTAENLDLDGGSLTGTGEMIVTGTLNWTGGNMAEAGTTKIAAEGVLTMSGTGSKVLESGRKLDIAGDAVWMGSGDIFIGNGSKFHVLAGGTFDAQNDKQLSSFGVVGSFTNAGTFIKSVGMGTTNVAILPFNNTGTVEVRTGTLRFSGDYIQTAGATLLNGGAIDSTTTLNIQAGSLSGAGTVFADVDNDGDAFPGGSAGILVISGDYTQGATGTLNIEIGGLTVGKEYDQLAVLNDVNLAGTLNISIINGFPPMLGDTFEVLTFGFRDGVNDDFTTVNGLDAGVGLVFQLNYGLTELTLEVVAKP